MARYQSEARTVCSFPATVENTKKAKSRSLGPLIRGFAYSGANRGGYSSHVVARIHDSSLLPARGKVAIIQAYWQLRLSLHPLILDRSEKGILHRNRKAENCPGSPKTLSSRIRIGNRYCATSSPGLFGKRLRVIFELAETRSWWRCTACVHLWKRLRYQ